MTAETSFGTRADDLFGRHERVVRVLRHQFDGGRAVERRAPGDEDVQCAAERVDVGAVIDGRGVAALLRRHVRRRAERDPNAGQPVVRQRAVRFSSTRRGRCRRAAPALRVPGFYQTEVGDLHQPLLVEEEVVRFHVAVDHAAVVRVLQPACGLKDVPDGRFRVELPLRLDEVGERLPANVLHAEEPRALRLADVVDLDDVRVRELSRGERLAGEPGDEHRVGRVPLAHDLQRDRSVERELRREVHGTHPAAPEFALDGIPADLRARGESRFVRFIFVGVRVRATLVRIGVGARETEDVRRGERRVRFRFGVECERERSGRFLFGAFGQTADAARGPGFGRHPQQERLGARRALGPVAARLGGFQVQAVCAVRTDDGHGGHPRGAASGSEEGVRPVRAESGRTTTPKARSRLRREVGRNACACTSEARFPRRAEKWRPSDTNADDFQARAERGSSLGPRASRPLLRKSNRIKSNSGA